MLHANIPPERVFVTWPALLTTLGGFSAFILSVCIAGFHTMEARIDTRLDRTERLMLHIDKEVQVLSRTMVTGEKPKEVPETYPPSRKE